MNLKITMKVATIRRTSRCIFLTGHDAEGRWRECRFKPECEWLLGLSSAWIEVTGRPGIAWLDRTGRVVLIVHSEVARRAPKPNAIADAGPVPAPRRMPPRRKTRRASRNSARTGRPAPPPCPPATRAL